MKRFFQIFTLIIALLILLNPLVMAQIIPESRRADWSVSGYSGVYPASVAVVDVTDYGAVGDGVTDDHGAVVSAIGSLAGQMGVVFFSARDLSVRGYHQPARERHSPGGLHRRQPFSSFNSKPPLRTASAFPDLGSCPFTKSFQAFQKGR